MAMGFAIPLTTAGANLLLVLLLTCWLLSGDWREKYNSLRHSPVALTALALYVLLVLGML